MGETHEIQEVLLVLILFQRWIYLGRILTFTRADIQIPIHKSVPTKVLTIFTPTQVNERHTHSGGGFNQFIWATTDIQFLLDMIRPCFRGDLTIEGSRTTNNHNCTGESEHAMM